MSTTNVNILNISSGLKIPALNQTQINNLGTVEKGRAVFNTSVNRVQFWDGTQWKFASGV